ncbi:MAG TPA: RNA polymerase-binding protein DksA, partial [Chitinolyticbacter sp.]|nr:RNA polymerase-binding protein DksA [Chitinolyticbacter sp.]
MAKLTEQDILAWNGSEEDYMNADHLAFFRERLLQMKAELLANANQTSQHLQEQEATPDPADRATLEEEYALELRTRDRERKLLLKIDSTVRKIDDGSYGYCEDTGEPIGLA